MLSGRALGGSGQLVLGPQTLAALGKRVGDTVTVTDGAPQPYTLRIVGTATLPAIGIASTMHTEMGSGAIVPYQDIPGADAAQPNAILVSLRPGADLAAAAGRPAAHRPGRRTAASSARAAARRDHRLPVHGHRAADPRRRPRRRRGRLTVADPGRVGPPPPQRAGPAEGLGFTRRQLAATVAWQSTTAVAAGAVVGVPLGIALGRCLWDLFAGQISVVPEPSVPGARSPS